MPALPLDDIRARARALWDVWTRQPENLAKALRVTWEKLGFQGHKPGQGRIPDATPTYHVAEGILHILTQTWLSLAQQEPEHLDAFLGELWNHPVLESREAAILLWAKQPHTTPHDLERFWNWYEQTHHDPTLQKALLEHIAPRLARERTKGYQQTLFRHIQAASPQNLPRLLPLLLPLLYTPNFDDFPTLRQHLTPHLSPPAKENLPEWVPVLRALFRRWPGETMPWLRRMAHTHPSETWPWMFRRLYPWLEEPWKSRLRELSRTL